MVEVVYAGVTNYEGRKVMVYYAPSHVVREQRVLDPHFCNDPSHLSPFARFKPTEEGWEAAIELATTMDARQGNPSAERRSAWDRLTENDK